MPLLKSSYSIFFKKLDRGFIELVGPLGIIRLVKFFIGKVSLGQTGLIYDYIFIIVFFLVLILFIIMFENIIFLYVDSFMILFLILLGLWSIFSENKYK